MVEFKDPAATTRIPSPMAGVSNGGRRVDPVVARSQTLDSLAPLAVARWVTLLATPWTSLANAQRPASFLTRIQTTTTYNRIDNHRQVRQRTVVKPTRCSSSGCSHRREFPKACSLQNSPNGTMYIPMQRLIYLITGLALF